MTLYSKSQMSSKRAKSWPLKRAINSGRVWRSVSKPYSDHSLLKRESSSQFSKFSVGQNFESTKKVSDLPNKSVKFSTSSEFASTSSLLDFSEPDDGFGTTDSITEETYSITSDELGNELVSATELVTSEPASHEVVTDGQETFPSGITETYQSLSDIQRVLTSEPSNLARAERFKVRPKHEGRSKEMKEGRSTKRKRKIHEYNAPLTAVPSTQHGKIIQVHYKKKPTYLVPDAEAYRHSIPKYFDIDVLGHTTDFPNTSEPNDPNSFSVLGVFLAMVSVLLIIVGIAFVFTRLRKTKSNSDAEAVEMTDAVVSRPNASDPYSEWLNMPEEPFPKNKPTMKKQVKKVVRNVSRKISTKEKEDPEKFIPGVPDHLRYQLKYIYVY